jgi:hypothetical protein
MADDFCSSNDVAPFLGPDRPTYPVIDSFVRVSTGGSGVLLGFAQQLYQNSPPAFRDREQVYIFDPNGSFLQPGYYDARLVSSYGGLPLYATYCCPGSKSDSSSSSSGGSLDIR